MGKVVDKKRGLGGDVGLVPDIVHVSDVAVDRHQDIVGQLLGSQLNCTVVSHGNYTERLAPNVVVQEVDLVV